MMPVNEMMLAISSSLPASIAVKATFILALAITGTWFTRSNRAAVRHALLAAAFGVLLLLPIASVVAPPVRITVLATEQERIAPPTVADTISSLVPSNTKAGATSATPQSSGFPLSAPIMAGWLAVAALFFLPVVAGLMQVRSVRRSGLPWRHGQAVVDKLAQDVGIHREVKMLLHESAAGPMTCGVLRPAVVLPPDAQSWDEESLTRAIVHELEHIRRRDWVSHCVARGVCAMYWFHPLVWIAWRQLTLEAERSCDDMVLMRSEATAYADQLVGLARRLSKSSALAMANRADLASRVAAVLDSSQQRGRAGIASVGFACIAAALLLTTSPLRIVAAPQSPVQPATTVLPAFEVASIKAWPSDRVGGVTTEFSANTLTLRGIDLWIGIVLAYGVRDFQISGPEWLKMPPAGSGNRYDIVAKASGSVPESRLRLMLRTLLAERFHMAVHWEKKEMPVLALLVAGGGLKIHETPTGTPVESSWNGFTNVRHELIRDPDGRGGHSFTNAPMAALAAALSATMPFAPEPFVDMTELPGRFTFVLHDAPRLPRSASNDPPNFDDMIATQKTIVQNELGLTWERRKAPVDVLVIDHADKIPTEN